MQINNLISNPRMRSKALLSFVHLIGPNYYKSEAICLPTRIMHSRPHGDYSPLRPDKAQSTEHEAFRGWAAKEDITGCGLENYSKRVYQCISVLK